MTILAIWAAIFPCLPVELPPESDLLRFPPGVVANENWQMGYQYYWTDAPKMGLNQQDIDELREDALYCYRAWDWLDNAHKFYSQRRHWLGMLRDHIGYKAYYSGYMPPPLPVWRFSRID